MLSSSKLLPRILPIVGLVLLVVLAFWPALSGGFIFDDYPVFAENQVLRATGWHWQDWQQVWGWSHNNIQRPMAMLTYALNYALGNGTLGFKLTNLGIHLLNTALVLSLLECLFKKIWAPVHHQSDDHSSLMARYWAFGVAAAWSIHPLQVSTVMYVVQRMEMLSFTFVLLALLAYWHGRQLQMSGARAWPWIVLAAVLAGVGLSFKETAVLAPGYALLIELTVLQFSALRPTTAKAWKGLYGTGCIMSLIFVAAYFAPHYANPAFYVGRDFSAWQRELTQLRVLPMYIGWALLPMPSHLQFYYDNYPASVDVLHPVTTALGGICLFGLLLLAVATYKRRPLIALGIGWFFVAHLLTSAPVPLELVFEHRNYPALLGLLLAVGDAVYWLSQRTGSKLVVAIACVLVLNLAFLTTLRSATWGDPLRLSMVLTEINPGSSRAALDLARRLMAMSHGNADSPMYSMSIQELERAARLPSASPLPEETLLLEASKHPGTVSETWWNSLRSKLENRPLIPDTFLALHKLTAARLAGNTGIDAQQLAQCYAIAIRRSPNRQGLRVEYAELASTALGDAALASEQWRQALRLDPDLPNYTRSLASYLASTHRNQEARAVISYAMNLRSSLQNDAQLKDLLNKVDSVEDNAKTSPLPAQPSETSPRS